MEKNTWVALFDAMKRKLKVLLVIIKDDLVSLKNGLKDFLVALVGLSFFIPFCVGAVIVVVNIWQVVGQWMKTGQWGNYSTIEDITGKWELSHDAWYIEFVIAGLVDKLPSSIFVIGIACVMFGVALVLFKVMGVNE